jgi:hypothetical protein
MFFKTSVFRFFCISAITLGCLAGLFFFCTSPGHKAEFEKTSPVQHASHADYIFLKDPYGQEWIYKQITEKSADDQLSILLEALASDIATALDFPLNQVKLIRAEDTFDHRIWDRYPGSLHLKVPGLCVEQVSPWADFDIHQKFRTPFMIASKGVLDPQEIGLRRITIQNMSKHSDLPKIVALDTYLGNIDRSAPNVFYERASNRFYGIDMGNCLMANLAQCAHESLERLFSERPFSEEERQGLREYHKALLTLIEKFPPEKTLALLNQHLTTAGFVPSNDLLLNEDTEQKIAKWKRMIKQSYQSSLDLSRLLEKIDQATIDQDTID